MSAGGTDEDATEDGLRERGFCDDGLRDLYSEKMSVESSSVPHASKSVDCYRKRSIRFTLSILGAGC